MTFMYGIILPGVVCVCAMAFVNMFFVTKNELRYGLHPVEAEATAEQSSDEPTKRDWRYWINLVLTVIMIALLFMDTPLPLYVIFMIAYALALVVNFPTAKLQNKKIKELGQDAMVMTVTLFSVGIFMGIISRTGMVDAMATAIVNVLPSAMAPHGRVCLQQQ